VFANVVGLIVFLQSRTDRLLAAVVDPLSPDWPVMERAFAGFTLYAGSLVGTAALGVLLVLRHVMRRARPDQGATTTARSRHAMPIAALATGLTAAVVLVFIEVLIFQDYGIHFYEFDVLGILADAALRRDLGIQPAEVARVTGAAVVLLGAELLLCVAAIRLARWRDGALARACGAAMLVVAPGGLVLFRASEQTIEVARTEFESALPLGRQLLFRTEGGAHIPVEPKAGPDEYPRLEPGRPAPRLARTPNIVFYVPDGLRADMVRPELTPNILRFSQRPEVIASARHFSTGHVSESGIFGLVYGVGGHAFNAFLADRVTPFPLEVLRRNGYHTFFLSSSRLNPYPTDQLIRVFDEVAYPRDDDEALRALDAYLQRRRADGRPYFVLAFLYTPHYPFTTAKPHLRKYPSVGPKARPNYMNDVIQADDYFRQAFGLLREDYDAGKTVLLVTSDHGEEIRDHGTFGHASPVFWNERIQVPFALGLPGPPRLAHGSRVPALSSHVDVWPTLFDALGVETLPNGRSWSDGTSLLRSTPTEVLVTGRFFPFADRPSVLIDRERKYWFRVDGVDAAGRLCLEVTRVTDLDDAAVPGERAIPAPAAARLDSTFWKFLRAAGPQPAPCSTA